MQDFSPGLWTPNRTRITTVVRYDGPFVPETVLDRVNAFLWLASYTKFMSDKYFFKNIY